MDARIVSNQVINSLQISVIIGTLKHLPKASILPTLPETGRPMRIE